MIQLVYNPFMDKNIYHKSLWNEGTVKWLYKQRILLVQSFIWKGLVWEVNMVKL